MASRRPAPIHAAWGLLAALFVGIAAGANDPPQVLYGPLYRAVADARIFEDSKKFADALPKSRPDEIVAAYRREKPQSVAALKAFVATHFTLADEAVAPASPTDKRSLGAHIDALWPRLVRSTPTAPRYSSLIALPYPYVVPGGRFREIYYWDSYFTMLGLAESGRQDLVRNMVRNFAYLIDSYGHIPNGNRTYYLSRSQPPFFYAMVGLLEPADPAKAYAQYLPELEAEYRFWMRGSEGLRPGQARERAVALPDGTILNRYWDDSNKPRDESFREDEQLARTTQLSPAEVYRNIRAAAESGWDFSARWFSDGKSLSTIATTEVIPVDLNSLMFGLENAIAEGCKRLKQNQCEHEFAAKAAKRRSAVNRYLWNDGTYVDYRWTQKRPTGVLSAAMYYPLFTGLADKKQAHAVAAIADKKLLKAGGIVTTTVETHQQWDAPNGWAPLQWVAVSGLRRYDERSAETISCRWIVNVNAVYRRSGKLVEKYDVITLNRPGGGGEYTLQDGFGWTNGVTRKLLALYPAFTMYTSADQCPAKH